MAGVGVSAETHKIAVIFHWLFKIAAVVFFFFCTLITSSFVINFVVCTVLIALDFWTVKNVTGRLLVGLRWWNEANDSGSAWRFEQAAEGSRVIHPGEKRMFWLGLFAGLVAWVALTFFEIVRLKFDYLIIPIIGTILNSSNFVGYFKCSREAGEQLQAMTSNLMSRAATHAVTSSLTPSRV
mmetsp:Transcript_15385/g.26631  ORF Transcript_15385/g.26631 Transcript_15385/m.26631 type:complete len:182 (+) Transcript_15385:89-634(+)